jgi:hypothetical protein
MFSVSHLYAFVETMIATLIKVYDDDELELELFDVKSNLWGMSPPIEMPNMGIGSDLTNPNMMPYDICDLLKHYSKTMINTTLISDEIENVIAALITIPNLKECFVMKEINSDNPRHLHNRPRVRINMDDNFAKALDLYQPELWEDLKGEESITLQLDWYLLFSKDTKFHQTLYLVLFNYFIHENYQFTYWLFRYVDPWVAFREHPKKILKYTYTLPRFVQFQPYLYHLVWQGQRLYHTNMAVMMYSYMVIVVTECDGLLQFETSLMEKVPQIYTWKKILPFHVPDDVGAIFRTTVNIKNILEKFDAYDKTIKEEASKLLRELDNPIVTDVNTDRNVINVFNGREHNIEDPNFLEILNKINNKLL